ncbi:MAG: hypothetical protein AAF501_08155 [Pseudomonadota bacterium]
MDVRRSASTRVEDVIAIIGWGSLIWDLEVLEPQTCGAWQMNFGPRLHMEFTRISPKRKMGLAVCLDRDVGDLCQTHVISSSRNDISDALRDLALRERTDPQNIGAICLDTGFNRSHDPAISDQIGLWCGSVGIRGAVWTDIGPNFSERRGGPFTVERGVSYLKTLTGESLDEAVRYIENAPSATDTPLRRALSVDDWWVREARRLELR